MPGCTIYYQSSERAEVFDDPLMHRPAFPHLRKGIWPLKGWGSPEVQQTESGMCTDCSAQRSTGAPVFTGDRYLCGRVGVLLLCHTTVKGEQLELLCTTGFTLMQGCRGRSVHRALQACNTVILSPPIACALD